MKTDEYALSNVLIVTITANLQHSKNITCILNLNTRHN